MFAAAAAKDQEPEGTNERRAETKENEKKIFLLVENYECEVNEEKNYYKCN